MRSLLLLAAALLSGCPGAAPVDPVDAGVDAARADARAADAGCLIAASLGDLGALSGDAESDAPLADASYILLLADINGDARPDELSLELYPVGVFAAGISPGTFDLGSLPAETQYATCGACVRLLADVDPGTGAERQDYMIVAGSLTLTSVVGQLAGHLDGASFVRVTIAGDSTSTPTGDCPVSLGGAAFDATITVLP